MRLQDSLREIYETRGYTLRNWSSAVGVTHGVLSKVVNGVDPKLGSLIRYIAPLGYQVALVPTGTKLPDGAYVIDSSGPKPEPTPYDLDDPDLLIG